MSIYLLKDIRTGKLIHVPLCDAPLAAYPTREQAERWADPNVDVNGKCILEVVEFAEVVPHPAKGERPASREEEAG